MSSGSCFPTTATDSEARALPDWPANTAPFPGLAAAPDCGANSAPGYALADLDRDRRPDLVVTFACGDGGVGGDRWLAFPNEGAGFGDPEAFLLPAWPGSGGFPFDALGGPGSCGDGNNPGFGLLDLTGDGPDPWSRFPAGTEGLVATDGSGSQGPVVDRDA